MNHHKENPETASEKSKPEDNREDSLTKEARVEQHVLKFSVWGSVFFALLGIFWGILARSQMVAFDAIYSFISVLLSGASLFVAGSVRKGDDEMFPFGRVHMEPLTVAIKSSAIAIFCLISFIQAIISLFSGGREVDAVYAIIYALIGSAGCFGGFLYMRVRSRQARTSDLIRSESMQWLMDGMSSTAVLAGFLVAYLMGRTGFENWARYMDPLMVIIASSLFIKSPVLSLIASTREMLMMVPVGDVYPLAQQAMDELAQRRGFVDAVVKVSKIGREFDYKVSFVAGDPQDRRSLAELDEIREEVLNRLQSLSENQIWLGVSFIHDRKWA